jgi:hypothetical protein
VRRCPADGHDAGAPAARARGRRRWDGGLRHGICIGRVVVRRRPELAEVVPAEGQYGTGPITRGSDTGWPRHRDGACARNERDRESAKALPPVRSARHLANIQATVPRPRLQQKRRATGSQGPVCDRLPEHTSSVAPGGNSGGLSLAEATCQSIGHARRECVRQRRAKLPLWRALRSARGRCGQ